jgi:hypothetical protein
VVSEISGVKGFSKIGNNFFAIDLIVTKLERRTHLMASHQLQKKFGFKSAVTEKLGGGFSESP